MPPTLNTPEPQKLERRRNGNIIFNCFSEIKVAPQSKDNYSIIRME